MSTINVDEQVEKVEEQVEEAKEELPKVQIQTYRTKDLNLAAFLWCQPNTNLIKMQGKGGKGTTVFFVFDIETNDLSKLIFDYTNRKTFVEPLEFCSRQTSLRDLLYGGLKREVSEEV